MTYNRNPNGYRYNGSGGERSGATQPATFVWFQPLDRDDIAASIETYSTAKGRLSAFSRYVKRTGKAGEYDVWERTDRAANLDPKQALEFMNNFRDGKAEDNDAL